MSDERSGTEINRSTRILVVDDEEVVRSVILATLEGPDRFLVEASDGEEAIEKLLSEPFDILIADKNLPGITGLDVIRQAKKVDPRMGTLLVTAFASRETAEEAMALGVDDYLTKPFDMSTLVQKVEEALLRRQHRAKTPAALKNNVARLQVLICDPQDGSRRLLMDAIGALGHRVRFVSDLSRVLQMLRTGQMDALVCDLETLARDDATACFLRSSLAVTPAVRFVAVAARRGLDGAIEAIGRGAGLVLYRPLGAPEEVIASLQDFLGRAL